MFSGQPLRFMMSFRSKMKKIRMLSTFPPVIRLHSCRKHFLFSFFRHICTPFQQTRIYLFNPIIIIFERNNFFSLSTLDIKCTYFSGTEASQHPFKHSVVSLIPWAAVNRKFNILECMQIFLCDVFGCLCDHLWII